MSCWLKCPAFHGFLYFLFQFVTFYFPDCGKLPPPVVQVQNVSFQYADDKVRKLGTTVAFVTGYRFNDVLYLPYITCCSRWFTRISSSEWTSTRAWRWWDPTVLASRLCWSWLLASWFRQTESCDVTHICASADTTRSVTRASKL